MIKIIVSEVVVEGDSVDLNSRRHETDQHPAGHPRSTLSMTSDTGITQRGHSASAHRLAWPSSSYPPLMLMTHDVNSSSRMLKNPVSSKNRSASVLVVTPSKRYYVRPGYFNDSKGSFK